MDLGQRLGRGGRRPPGSDGDSGPPQVASRHSANPYAPVSVARRKGTGFSFNLGVLLLWICGIALMYGSIGSWVHVSGALGIGAFHVSFNGIDPVVSTLISVNGWVTFIGGILLVIFACFEMTSDELMLSIFTTVIAAIVTVFAIYDMFRIVQKMIRCPPRPVRPSASGGAHLRAQRCCFRHADHLGAADPQR